MILSGWRMSTLSHSKLSNMLPGDVSTTRKICQIIASMFFWYVMRDVQRHLLMQSFTMAGVVFGEFMDRYPEAFAQQPRFCSLEANPHRLWRIL